MIGNRTNTGGQMPLNNPVLSFSPDGIETYFLFMNWKMFLVMIAVVMGACSLALVKVYELVCAVVGFFLTAPAESILRLFAFLIIAGLLGIAPLALKVLRSHWSFLSTKKGGEAC